VLTCKRQTCLHADFTLRTHLKTLPWHYTFTYICSMTGAYIHAGLTAREHGRILTLHGQYWHIHRRIHNCVQKQNIHTHTHTHTHTRTLTPKKHHQMPALRLAPFLGMPLLFPRCSRQLCPENAMWYYYLLKASEGIMRVHVCVRMYV
jgi:hypothetical protein